MTTFRPMPATVERGRAAVDRGSAAIHPVAWWIWALGMAAAANRTTNPEVLGLLLAVAGYVVATCRSREPWTAGRAGGFGSFLRLGLAVIGMRTLFHVALGSPTGGTVILFRLPRLPLLAWATGIQLGGPVYAEGLIGTVYDSLRLAVMLCCIGAAVALADPRRLLASLPGALYEVGVAVVVAMSLAPEMIASTQRVRRARELRGDALTAGRDPIRRARAFARVALPVLADATDRSLVLAASMDARGYGRTAGVPRRLRRITGALILTGLCGLSIGAYSLLDTTAPGWASALALLVGVGLSGAGLWLGSRRVSRTRFAAGVWTVPSALVAQSGTWALVGSLLAAWWRQPLDPPGVLSWPPLPVAAFLGALVALTPALLPRSVPPGRR